MKKIVLVLALMAGFIGKQHARAEGGGLMAAGAVGLTVGIVFLAASASGDDNTYSYTDDKDKTTSGSAGAWGAAFMITGGVLLLSGLIYWAASDSKSASLRIPLGDKRYAWLRGGPVVTPRFQGVGISIRF